MKIWKHVIGKQGFLGYPPSSLVMITFKNLIPTYYFIERAVTGCLPHTNRASPVGWINFSNHNINLFQEVLPHMLYWNSQRHLKHDLNTYHLYVLVSFANFINCCMHLNQSIVTLHRTDPAITTIWNVAVPKVKSILNKLLWTVLRLSLLRAGGFILFLQGLVPFVAMWSQSWSYRSTKIIH